MSATSRTSLCACVMDDHDYVTPRRAVMTIDDMQIWEKSEAYHDYVAFFTSLNESVKNLPVSAKYPYSENCKAIVDFLDTLEKWTEDYPPVEQPQRFGNQAFRQWHKKLSQDVIPMLQKAFPQKYHRAIPEVMVYMTESFGNPTRIDYGTGHEMAFIWFLCCCYKIGIFTVQDNAAVVLKIFNKYMNLVRRLQTVYRMEPAGSHGVWSLDDYQFMPFIWGSSQLTSHPKIEPKSFLLADVVETYKNEFLFIACIDFINRVKTGPFPEHSNQLWNISGVITWSKINQGLIKMYKAEVLSKFPVIQHVLFGSLMTFKVRSSSSIIRNVRLSVTPPDPMKSLMDPPSTLKPNMDAEAPKERRK
ncbi:hypothetical protein RUM44_003638 [Polyplax serrata]|uniref:Serine/threonine-protein phosphatase 2A activator n=1 Tax=Polyplax serrata TaxID=468196 RepID=A0ABR1AH20_POLSC